MSLCQYLGGFLHCFNHCSRRSSNSAKTGLRLQSFSRSCIIGGRFFRSCSKTAAYRKTNGKKDIRLRPCRCIGLYVHVQANAWVCVPQTRCCIEPPPSVAVLNAYLRVHGSTSSLPRKFEVKECTGRTFFNDDIHSGRKMVGIPPSHE